MLSVIVPAYNEEKYLTATLESIRLSLHDLSSAELIVVDNESTDATGEIAINCGARVVDETVHNIGRARNTGAAAASGDMLVFIDSDTLVPPTLFKRIAELSNDKYIVGGSVAVCYKPLSKERWIRLYIFIFQKIGRLLKWRQGAAQFCRAAIFRELGGYDETIYVGEDVEFHGRLAKHARATDRRVEYIEDLKVSTSPRRFEGLGLVRSLFYTHPVTVLLGWRIRFLWKYWYQKAIR